MIGQTISHYKILSELGEGGMGVVYKAEDTKLKRTVALKFLSPQALGSSEEKARFIHEAQAAASLEHANICTIYDFNEIDGKSFITMAFVDGPSLQKEIEAGPLAIDRALELSIQMAEGLQEAHEKGIVHRDIKPTNVMLTSKGQVKITDFGLAKLPGRTRLTKTGSTVGTVAYMSPEQARGEAVDHRTDIWSLGVVLYEMVTGRVPFKSDYEQAVIYSIMNEAPEPMTALRTGVPVDLERIAGKAMEKEPGRRYQRAEEMLVDLRNLRDERVPGGRIGVRARKSRRRVIGYGLALLAAAAVLLVGLKIRIDREPPAQAAENKLAVMYFENMAEPGDPGRLGEIVTNLLITDLSESHYLQVVSSQRLYDILKLLGKEGVKVVDRDLASQVAGKANAKWMLLGSILQVEPQVVLTAQLVEVGSGNAVASQKITGEAGEKVFTLVDKLTAEVKNDLSLPAAAKKEPDRPVADVTTNSAEAYRHYIEGMNNLNIFFHKKAVKDFKKALEYDSTMALAYYELSDIVPPPEDSIMIAKALRYSSKVSRREQLLIKARHAMLKQVTKESVALLQRIIELYPEDKNAYYILAEVYEAINPDFEILIELHSKIVELDPLYGKSHSMLAYLYAYHSRSDYDMGIAAIDRGLSLLPNDANLYDTKGDVLALNGKLDQALECYKRALEISPDFDVPLTHVGNVFLFKRDYARAESTFRVMTSSTDAAIRSKGRMLLSYIPAYRGQLDAAIAILDDGIAADRLDRPESEGIWALQTKYYFKALLLAEKGRGDAVRKQIKILSELVGNNPTWMRQFLILNYTKCGMVAEAESISATVKRDCEKEEFPRAACYRWGLAHIELAKGNPASAADYFKQCIEGTPYPDFEIQFFLAKACLAAGKLGEAVEILERERSRYDNSVADYGFLAVKARYLLGLAYEQSGWTAKAIEQYREFLDIWKDADPDIEELADARERLGRLEGAR